MSNSPASSTYVLTKAIHTPINTAVVEMLMHITVSMWLPSWRDSSANTKIGFNWCLDVVPLHWLYVHLIFILSKTSTVILKENSTVCSSSISVYSQVKCSNCQLYQPFYKSLHGKELLITSAQTKLHNGLWYYKLAVYPSVCT